MNVTYIKHKNAYVDSAGRVASVKEYGRDFLNCHHEFKDTGRRGAIGGPRGANAAAYQCAKCLVFTIIEIMSQ